MSKRISVFLLTFILCVSIISCSADTPGESQDTTTSTSSNNTTGIIEQPDVGDGLGDTDMDGFVLRILHYDEWLSWSEIQLEATELNGEIFNDTIYQRNSYIEERFNCNISISEDPAVHTQIANLVMAGEDDFDIAMVYSPYFFNDVSYMSAWNDIPYLRFDEQYWNPNAMEVFAVGDKQLGITGNFTMSYISGTVFLAFNYDMYRDLGISEDIFELVRSGNWTLDTYATIAKQAISDSDGDGTIDTYGNAGSGKHYFNSLIAAAEAKYVVQDSNNYPVFNLIDDTSSVNKFIKILETHQAEPALYLVESDAADTFRAEKSLFNTTCPNWVGTVLREFEADLGFVPMPKYTERQTDYSTNTANGEVACLPRTVNKDERGAYIGILLEAMAYYSQNELLPVYRDTLIKTKYSRNEESTEMLDIIFGSISYDIGVNIWQDICCNPILDNVFFKLENNLTSQIASMTNTINAAIDKVVTASLEIDN